MKFCLVLFLFPFASHGQISKYKAYKVIIGSISNNTYQPKDSSESNFLVIVNLGTDQVLLYANQQEDKYDVVKVEPIFYDADSTTIMRMIAVDAKGNRPNMCLMLYRSTRRDAIHNKGSVGKLIVDYGTLRTEVHLRQND